jgi:hypothetical protein
MDQTLKMQALTIPSTVTRSMYTSTETRLRGAIEDLRRELDRVERMLDSNKDLLKTEGDCSVLSSPGGSYGMAAEKYLKEAGAYGALVSLLFYAERASGIERG